MVQRGTRNTDTGYSEDTKILEIYSEPQLNIELGSIWYNIEPYNVLLNHIEQNLNLTQYGSTYFNIEP